jgi:excisionase family DNA binding protein
VIRDGLSPKSRVQEDRGAANKKLVMSTTPQSDWLTAAEAAAYLKVKPRSLLLWVHQGKIKAYALSGTKRHIWRFRKEDLDAALLKLPVVPSGSLTVLSERRNA